MKVRVDDVCRQLYDSVLWSQKADEFLDTVDAQGLDQRLEAIDPGSAVAAELREQLEVVETVRRRRNETPRWRRPSPGSTLAVKTAGLALGAPGSGAEQRASSRSRCSVRTWTTTSTGWSRSSAASGSHFLPNDAVAAPDQRLQTSVPSVAAASDIL